MIGRIRFAESVSTLLVAVAVSASRGDADERHSVAPEPGTRIVSSSTPILANDFTTNFAQWSRGIPDLRIVLPPRPRVTRSHRPLRRITLFGGDTFVAECLEWGTQAAAFRLQSGQVLSLPVSAVSTMANPPGEVGVLVDSFEAGALAKTDSTLGRMLDETRAAGGRSSLRIDSSSTGYRQKLDPPLASARIEFSFQTAIHDTSSACGEWQLEWGDKDVQRKPLVVRVGSDRSVSVSGIAMGTESLTQTLKMSDGWHSFVALIGPDRIRLIVDEAILGSSPAPQGLLAGLHFRPADTRSKNVLWIDELQIQSLGPSDVGDPTSSESIDRDVLLTVTGDELFGRIIGVTDATATLETFSQLRSIPLNRLAAMNWNQSPSPIRQSIAPNTGVVARIEMQPFVDRPECQPEHWTVTIVGIDSQHLIVQHSLIGELKLRWSEVRRVNPLFFGQSLLADARRFHLGNSIRPDFHRHLPDGTEIRGEFVLQDIPSGQPSLSLDVAELEAAGPEAPPASPFLAQLRAGSLVTEVMMNDQRVGELNQQIRFKALSQNPDRVRIAIPRGLLKRGRNTFQLRQSPLKKNGREFDDCEVGNIRIDFEQK